MRAGKKKKNIFFSTRGDDLCPGQCGKSSSLMKFRAVSALLSKPLPNWNPPGTQGCILKYINPYFLWLDKLNVESLNQEPDLKRNPGCLLDPAQQRFDFILGD